MSPKPAPDREPGAVASLLTASLYLACSLAAFLPIQIYLANSAEYSSPLGTVVRAGACAAAAVFAVLAIVGLVLPRRVRTWWAAALVGLALAVYLQANFFVWNYGLLDGRDLQWARNAGKTGLELGVEGAILLLCLIFRRAVVRRGALVATLLLAAEGGVTAARIFTREPPPSSQFYSIDESRLVTFSPKHDIVVVLLDEFQSNILGNLLAASPVIQKRLDGFTYYPNAVSGFAKTYGSVPNILTGSFYDNRQTVREYLQHAYADSFLVDLKKAGYRVELYPWNVRVLHVDPSIASNVVARFPSALFPDELLPLFDVSLFRHVPHPLKKRVVGDGRWLVSRIVNAERTAPSARAPIANNALSDSARPRDLNFLNLLDRSTVATDPAPVFKFYHLQGPHEPLWLDADLQVRRLPNDRDGYLSQAKASLRIASELIAEIDRLGLADRTDLLVISDHGAGEYGIPPPDPHSGVHAVSPEIRSSGLPLVLFRRAGSHGPLKTSQLPVALVDLGPTVRQLAGLPRRAGERSLLDTAPDPSRLRKYYHYRFEGWDQRYLPPLEEFEVTGNSWDASSWRATGRVLSPDDVKSVTATAPREAAGSIPPLAAGPEVKVGLGEEGQAYLGKGWSGAEKRLTWSDGPRAFLHIPVSGDPGSYVLSLRLKPWLLPGRHDRQRVVAQINGHSAGTAVLEDTASLDLIVPAAQFATGKLSVELSFPDAASPQVDFQVSKDSRLLGAALYALSLSRLPDIPAGQPLTFDDAGNGSPFLLTNWCSAEPGGTWTNGHHASFAIPLASGSAARLVVDLVPYVRQPDIPEQKVTISAGGHVLGEWHVSGPGPQELSLPAGLATDGWLTLELDLPDAGRTFDAKVHRDMDTRLLGLRFRKLSFGE